MRPTPLPATPDPDSEAAPAPAPAPAIDCPGADALRRLLDDTLDPAEGDALGAHVEACARCREALEVMGGAWSLAARMRPLLAPPEAPGLVTASAVARLLQAPPPELLEAAARPAPPPRFPAIPGLTGAVPAGRGGMGVVFRARQEALDRAVAVKVIWGAASDPAHRARALREAVAMARLRHPNVVPLYGSGEAEGLPFLVMEWVDGGTLQDVVNQGPRPYHEAVSLVLPVARAVREAHGLGVVHRDLKPSNVLLERPPGGGPPVPKLSDFGLATWRGDDPGLTTTGRVVGTPSYMAPEQTGLAPGLQAVGPAADVHGLGALLYALLTGRPPYRGDSTWETLVRVARGELEPLPRARPGLPRDVQSVVARCLETAPARRYASAAEVVDDLERLLDGRPVAARPVSPPVRLAKWARRRPAAAALAAAALAAAAAGAVGGVYHVRTLDRSLLALRAERQRAGAALEAADRSRDRALSALSALDNQVVNRFFGPDHALETQGRALTERMVALYTELIPGPEEAGPAAASARAYGLGRRGHHLARLDRREEAAEAYRQSLDALDEVLAGPLPEGRREFFRAFQWDTRYRLFVTLSQLGRAEEADAVVGSLGLGPDTPRGPDRARALALLARRPNGLVDRHRRDEAEEAFRQAQAVGEAFHADDPHDPDVTTTLGGLIHDRAVNLANLGRDEEALARFREMLAVGESAAPDGPGWDGPARVVQTAARQLSPGLRAAGRPAEAAPYQRRWSEVARRLADAFPDQPRHRRERIDAAREGLEVAHALGRTADALPELREAAGLAEALARTGPPSTEADVEHGRLRTTLAGALCETGRYADALPELDHALAAVARWTAADPKPEAVALAAQARRLQARALDALGRPEEAARHRADADRLEPRS